MIDSYKSDGYEKEIESVMQSFSCILFIDKKIREDREFIIQVLKKWSLKKKSVGFSPSNIPYHFMQDTEILALCSQIDPVKTYCALPSNCANSPIYIYRALSNIKTADQFTQVTRSFSATAVKIFNETFAAAGRLNFKKIQLKAQELYVQEEYKMMQLQLQSVGNVRAKVIKI